MYNVRIFTVKGTCTEINLFFFIQENCSSKVTPMTVNEKSRF